MRPYQHKSLALIISIVYSLVFHAAGLGFVLTAPLFKDRVSRETYAVSIVAEEEGTVEITAVKAKDKVARARRMAAVKSIERKKNRQISRRIINDKEASISRDEDRPAIPQPEEISPIKEDTAITNANRTPIEGDNKRPETAPDEELMPVQAADTGKSSEWADKAIESEPEPAPYADVVSAEAKSESEEPSSEPGWQEDKTLNVESGIIMENEVNTGPVVQSTVTIETNIVNATEISSEIDESGDALHLEVRASFEMSSTPEIEDNDLDANLDIDLSGANVGIDNGSEYSPAPEVVAYDGDENTPAVLLEETTLDADINQVKQGGDSGSLRAEVIRGFDARGDEGVAVMTPTENRTPTIDQYLAALETDFKEKEKSDEIIVAEAEIGLPLYVQKDIEIKVFFEGSDSGISFRLSKRSHPMDGSGDKETDITETLEEVILADETGLRRLYSLPSAVRGTYIFVMANNTKDTREISIEFLFHRNLKSEKRNEYKGIRVSPNGIHEIKFLMPEALFWDDVEYFTGTVETGRYTTKFNDETGLIWKERTD